MPVSYNEEIKALPSEALYGLFEAVGWVKPGGDDGLRAHFNAPFVHSTFVVSAWDGDELVGVARVLSDTIIRAVLYDVAVAPAYQGQGIGKALVQRCITHYPGAEWLVTTEDKTEFYEKLGFRRETDSVFLRIPSVYQ